MDELIIFSKKKIVLFLLVSLCVFSVKMNIVYADDDSYYSGMDDGEVDDGSSDDSSSDSGLSDENDTSDSGTTDSSGSGDSPGDGYGGDYYGGMDDGEVDGNTSNVPNVSSDNDYNALVSHYNEALAALAAAQQHAATISPTTVDKLYTEVEKSKNALDSFCKNNSYTYSINPNTGYAVAQLGGHPVNKVGDPVVISSKTFVIDDTDMTVSCGSALFELTRNYRSVDGNGAYVSGGAFGDYWTSSLDTRIISGRESNAEPYKSQWNKFFEDQKEYEDELAGYAADDSDCENIYEEYLSKMESYKNEAKLVNNECIADAAAEEQGKYVSYGAAGYLARNIGTDSLIYVNDSGGIALFTLRDDGRYYPAKKRTGITYIAKKENGEYKCIMTDGCERVYSQYGQPELFTNRKGVSIQFLYNGNGQINKIDADGGRYISIAWKNGKVSSVASKKETYAYSYAGNELISVTDGNGDVRSFVYDEHKIITKQIYADGSESSFTYGEADSSGKRLLTTSVNQNGASDVIDYRNEDNGIVTYTDYDGVKSEYQYDAYGNTVSEKYSDGRIFFYEYDENNNLIEMRDSFGAIRYSYDAEGRMLSASYDDGSICRYVYTGRDMTEMTDRDGVVRTFDYDARGCCTAIRQGGKKVFDITYNSKGLPSLMKNCRGETVQFLYDANGDCVKRTTSSVHGKTTSEMWKYDDAGRVIQSTDKSGKITSYLYEPHRVTIINPNGLKTIYRYSNRSDIESIEEADMRSKAYRIFRYTYDKCHRCTSLSVEGAGNDGIRTKPQRLFTYAYTKAGRLSQIVKWNTVDNEMYVPTDAKYTQPLAWVRDNTWMNGILAESTYGSILENGAMNANSRKFLYEEMWNTDGHTVRKAGQDSPDVCQLFNRSEKLISEVTNDAVTQQNEYSAGGRLAKFKTIYGGMILLNYDSSSGFLTNFEEDSGTVKSGISTYYADGKKQSSIDSEGNETDYQYDEDGNICEVNNKYRTLLIERDDDQRICSEKIISKSGKVVYEKSFEYKDDVRTIIETVGSIYKKTYTYDAWNNCTLICDGIGNTTRFMYDVFGHCVECSTPSKNILTFVYNLCGQLIMQTDASGCKTYYQYDDCGNLTYASDEEGDIYRASYDSCGRKTSESFRPFLKTTQYTYDESGRIICKRQGTAVITYQYSKDGKSAVYIDAKKHTIRYTLDGFGRILTEADRLGNVSSFEYASDGAEVGLTDRNGKREIIAGSSNELKTIRTWNDGDNSILLYDEAGRITAAKNKKSSYEYTWDTAGHLLSQYDKKSMVRVSYEYDLCGRKTRMRGSDRDISYTYDSENNLIQISDISQNMKIKFVYDKNNREILRYYGSGESIRTQYDKAGHVTLKILYSSQNIPIAMEGNVYDADGARILCVSLEGCVTKFSYDSDGRISSVQYPYSDSISLYFKKKCAESGLLLKDSASLLHTISITSEQRTALENVCRQIGPSFVSILKLDHPLIEVSYSYDENSNCTAMETPWGTIQYKYDDDDRMVSFGKSGVCAYDNNGNLINENNLYNSKEYTYNNNNRMITAIARNLITQTQTQTVYVYDVFGRRIETEQTGIASRRTSYDGFTFEELTSEPISQAYLGNQENQSRTARSAENINAADNRYAWIYGEDTNMSKRSDETLWNGKNAALYDNDGRASFLHSSASTNTVESRAVLFSNVVGSVCASVRDDGIVSYASYDIFGAAVENTFDKNQTFGYAGKQIDNITGLYNYGFRDYQADTARFTTNDPIRDGTNWYTYCGCDPVNYVDLWGLAPQNITESEHNIYVEIVESFADYNKESNDHGIPSTYDCADVATYIYTLAMDSINQNVSLTHNGTEVSLPSQMQSQDYFAVNIGNVTYYDDRTLNNPYVEAGTIAVWAGKDGDHWIGHVATVISVERNTDGKISNITTIQGHTGGSKTEIVKDSARDWGTYRGVFVGFAEIGYHSINMKNR